MLEYEIRGRMVVILGCSKDEVDIDIPEQIEGLPVSKIESNAFIEVPKLKRVVIPGTVKIVGSYAFAACPLLKEVILEEGVETIDDWAFISCAITKISLPKTLKSVGNNAFLGNMVKPTVTEFMEKNSMRRPKTHTNNKCCVLPIELIENTDSIDGDIIQNRSKYVDEQFDQIDAMLLDEKALDVPFIFDGMEFMIAVFNKKPLEDLTFEISPETKSTIGLYSENDPDYLILRINILAAGQYLTTFVIKAPYLEALDFKLVDIKTKETNGTYYYFLHTKANFACFGNGNIEREFALNYMDDLYAKYQTQLANNIITEEQYNSIKEKLDNKALVVMNGFLAQIDGAPRMTNLVNIYRHVLDDLELYTDEINEFVYNKIFTYYNELSNFDSFEKICFDDLDETEAFITAATGLSFDELNARYDIELIDANGYAISKEDALAYKDTFIDLETNYTLHADFLHYLNKELKKLVEEFWLIPFSNE